MKIGINLGCMYNGLKLIFHLTFLSIKPRARASQTANIKLQYSKELRTFWFFKRAVWGIWSQCLSPGSSLWSVWWQNYVKTLSKCCGPASFISGNLSIESSFTYTVKGRVTANVRIKLRISQNKKISRQKLLKTILMDKKKLRAENY